MMKWSGLWQLKKWHILEYDGKKGTVRVRHDDHDLFHTVKLPALVTKLMNYEYRRGHIDRIVKIRQALNDHR